MTLPASFPLRMDQVATELGLSLPLSMNHAWVLALAQKSGLPVSFSDLLGKTGRFDGNLATTSANNVNVAFISNAPFFGGTIAFIRTDFGVNETDISFNTTPNWTGPILITNHSSGVSARVPYVGSGSWFLSGAVANLIRTGATADAFTIQPTS
ncbi:hypothetical protein VSR82_07905 [Burkholderia sp. JPY481]